MQGRSVVGAKEVGAKEVGMQIPPQNIAWDVANADYLEELVKSKLISKSAAAKKVWTEHLRCQKYSFASIHSAPNKMKDKYQFHM